MALKGHKLMLALTGTENFLHAEADDFIISLRSFQGGIERCFADGCVSPAYTVLKPSKDVEVRFFAYLLKSAWFVSVLQSRTTGIREGKTITYPQFASIELPLPSLAEQAKIADFLDREIAEADALIAKYQRLIDLLNENHASTIAHAVTKGLNPHVEMVSSGVEWIGQLPAHWILTPLKHVVRKLTVGIVVTPAAYYVDEGVPCLRSLNIKERLIVPDDLVYISAESNELHKKSKIYTGDLVIVRTGQTGTAAVVDERFNNANCIDLIIARPSKSTNAFFLAYYLNSDAAKAQYEQHSGGAIQQHFNIGIAGSLSVSLPPEEEQRDIVRFLDGACNEISRTIEITKAAIDLTRERRSAIITAAVTGRINVRSYDATRKMEAVS